ncbi:MAG: PQQ-binding-like beta-propeller repeat protein [Pseudohongiellaceae bacterium]
MKNNILRNFSDQLILLSGLLLFQASLFAADDSANIAFTEAQASAGAENYATQCASCHGENLEGFGLVPALGGDVFVGRWGDRPADQLATNIQRMPPGGQGSLSNTAYAEILAYVLAENGLPPSNIEVPAELAQLSELLIPAAQLTRNAEPAALLYHTDGPLLNSSLLDALTPVTDAMLLDPPADDWLNWRRTRDAFGHSPLDQINKENVEDLQLAWSWALPAGENMMTPIVHDGVMFAYSYGDVLQALDAATGELLWSFQRELEGGKSPGMKKGAAIYDDKIVIATSDIHLIALNAKTGAVDWDHKVDGGGEDSFLFRSAPLIANGKAIIGLTGRVAVEGGDFIFAVDMETGEEVWRFYTIARPDEPGGNSWNGLPLEQRNGGSIWIPGSFDADLNLVYFGPAPTYDTNPLRSPHPDPTMTRDALYTNSTVALDADTGELVWHYQHISNDQLDHDWAFERQIMELTIAGVTRKAVVTGGKLAIFEALDAATGEYLFSFDLDMQNVVTEIDSRTGRKTISPAAIPELDQVISQYSMPGICPDWLGARNMQATAYNPNTKRLFIPISDTCLDDDSGERWQKYPDDATDGSWGIIKAVDLQTQDLVWEQRQTGPQASANLTTDSGLLFIGSVDRWFKALDQDTGNVLWQRRLDNALNSYPVTYSVDGKQYVAVATNSGGIHTRTMKSAAGITLPVAGATMWVFALPEKL